MSLHPTPKQIELYIEKAFEDGFNFIMKGKVRKTNTIKKNFLAFELRRLKTWKQYKPTFVEKRFKVTIFPDLPDFIGYLDFYSQEDETIIDWKSGGLEMNEPTKIQGKVYELAMQAMNLPASKSLFFALRDGRLLEVPKLTKGCSGSDHGDDRDGARTQSLPEVPHFNEGPYTRAYGDNQGADQNGRDGAGEGSATHYLHRPSLGSSRFDPVSTPRAFASFRIDVATARLIRGGLEVRAMAGACQSWVAAASFRTMRPRSESWSLVAIMRSSAHRFQDTRGSPSTAARILCRTRAVGRICRGF